MRDKSQNSHRRRTRRKRVRSSLVFCRGGRRETASSRSSGVNRRERVLVGVSGKRKTPAAATGMAAMNPAVSTWRTTGGWTQGGKEDALAAPHTRNCHCHPLIPCTPSRSRYSTPS